MMWGIGITWIGLICGAILGCTYDHGGSISATGASITWWSSFVGLMIGSAVEIISKEGRL